jgi:hypothetical protein
MSMSKAALIAEIKSNFPSVTDASIAVAQAEDNNSVTWYVVNIFETGLSETNKKPTAFRKNVHFYVYKEGQGGEGAYYDRDEISNDVNNDVTAGSNSLSAMNKIFSSQSLRGRVSSAIMQAAYDVINEDVGTTNHAKRLLWAGQALSDVTTHVQIMMAFVALNATVQSAGGTASDNDLKYIVNSNINNACTILGI